MGSAILRLVRDPALRVRLGAAAHEEIVVRDYTWHGNAKRMLRVAESILNRSSADTR